MKISVIVINNNQSLLSSTLLNIGYQTHSDVQILEVNDNFNDIIQLIEGEYVIFLNAGDTFANDRVIEEIILNGLDKDIVYGNVILNREDVNDVDNYIIQPKSLTASSILLKDFPLQTYFIRSELVKFDFEINTIEEINFQIWKNIVIQLVNKHVSYKHVQIFIAECSLSNFDNDKKNEFILSNFPLLYKDYHNYQQLLSQNQSETQFILNKIAKTRFFKYLMLFRKKLEKWGWYALKRNIKQKRHYKKLKKQDEARKKQIRREIFQLKDNLLHRNNDETDVIVSLTSYGKRVNEAAPYAIYSLFIQDVLPNRIVLYLDKSWNDENLPALLKKLKMSGIEVFYVEDLKSYKKLIPSLERFPNNPIITVDDDIFYRETAISDLYSAYKNSDKKTVFCSWACIVQRVNDKFLPYSKWFDNKYGNRFSEYSPYGGSGTIYPPNIFDSEIINKDVFMNLIPSADDIWFWLHEYRNNIKVKLIPLNNYDIDSINRIDNYVEKGSTALYFQNVFHNKNDLSFAKILEHYNIQ